MLVGGDPNSERASEVLCRSSVYSRSNSRSSRAGSIVKVARLESRKFGKDKLL
jgi:hypothetical protein